MNERVVAFLSYSTKDRSLAGRIKRQLASYGINVFLAHQDLVPSQIWQNRIMKAAQTCDVFLPLLSNNFRNSKWTDQEAGMAMASSAVVLPLIRNLSSYGFLGRYQHLKLKIGNLRPSCEEIVLALKKYRKLRTKIGRVMIRSFSDSKSYDDANCRSGMLLRLGSYSRKQINEIFRGFLANDQIYVPFNAGRNVSTLLLKNRSLISRDLKKSAYAKSSRIGRFVQGFDFDEFLSKIK